jgi:hypothetical protein
MSDPHTLADEIQQVPPPARLVEAVPAHDAVENLLLRADGQHVALQHLRQRRTGQTQKLLGETHVSTTQDSYMC